MRSSTALLLMLCSLPWAASLQAFCLPSQRQSIWGGILELPAGSLLFP